MDPDRHRDRDQPDDQRDGAACKVGSDVEFGTTAGQAAVVVVRGCWRLRRLPETSPALAGGLVARGLGATGLGLAHAIRRPWAPPLLLAARRRAWARRALLAAFATAIVQDAVATRRLGPAVADVPVRILDEAVAAVGTWQGCLEERTLRPLLPSRFPPGRAGSR